MHMYKYPLGEWGAMGVRWLRPNARLFVANNIMHASTLHSHTHTHEMHTQRDLSGSCVHVVAYVCA